MAARHVGRWRAVKECGWTETQISKWDEAAEYWLPARIREVIGPLIAQRRNRYNLEKAIKWLCRVHGCNPEREFALDRRAIYKLIGLTEHETRTCIDQMEEIGFVDRLPDQPHAYKVDGEGQIKRFVSPAGKMQPHRRAIVFRFAAWVATALLYVLDHKPGADTVEPVEPESQPETAEKASSPIDRHKSKISQNKALSPTSQGKALSFPIHSRRASCGGDHVRKPVQIVPRVSQRVAPAEADPALQGALDRLEALVFTGHEVWEE